MNGFIKGYKDNRDNKEILDMYHDMHEMDTNYREKAFINASSNYGWYTCSNCGKKFRKADVDVDHIVPKSLDGSNSRYNLQILCVHCNRSKQADTSQTSADLRRRRKELQAQDKEDLKYLNNLTRRIK